MNLTRNHEVAGLIPDLDYVMAQALLWLRPRLAATVPIRPLAWEPPYASGAALKRPKTNKQTKKTQKTPKHPTTIHKDADLIPHLTQWIKDLSLL